MWQLRCIDTYSLLRGAPQNVRHLKSQHGNSTTPLIDENDCIYLSKHQQLQMARLTPLPDEANKLST